MAKICRKRVSGPVMELAVQSLRAVVDPIRLRIISLLGQHGTLCVCQISAVVEQPYSTLSKHLKELKQAGLLQDEKRGRWVYYGLARESWNPLSGKILSMVTDLHPDMAAVLEQDRQSLTQVLCCPLPEVARAGPDFLKSLGSRQKEIQYANC